MKVTGKNPRMFLGDKEIKGITSFSFDNSADFPDVASPFSEKETVEFSGIYDPSCTDGESRESISAKLGDEFMGTITLPYKKKGKKGGTMIYPYTKERKEILKLRKSRTDIPAPCQGCDSSGCIGCPNWPLVEEMRGMNNFEGIRMEGLMADPLVKLEDLKQ